MQRKKYIHLVPFDELPKDERDKDAIFLTFVWNAKHILNIIEKQRCEWLNPTWVCNVCGHVEYEEREVLCWDCGEGEMIYQPRCSKKIEVKNA